ncbi:MAG TPA: tyrosine/phenylalanine carboxypeptidase domain-containing protein [Polyangiaceae bacterium]|nr:tyrosine/phenylalanine carboxypeptidase domain-containing protein [Polyangiaceae bacterium]
MSLRRRHALAEPAARAALRLAACEAQIALLDRLRPQNLAFEKARLVRALEGGERPEPRFDYAAPPELGQLRRELDATAQALDVSVTEERLLAARAQELSLDAQLVEHVGSTELLALAGRRFPPPEAHDELSRLARQLVTTVPDASEVQPPGLHFTDDSRDPHSLWSELSRLIAAERWPVRVEVVSGLASLAAVAEGVVRVRAGAKLSARDARRIALHEVEGHVRPRLAGAVLGGVLKAGSARADEDEEGRAILLEERAGLLDAARRRELGRRYLAAASVREGAPFWDTVQLLGQLGATLAQAVELSCRVHRGGGLGRELIYLVGYRRVAARLAAEPVLERVMKHGRVSLDAAHDLLLDSIELDDDGDVI